MRHLVEAHDGLDAWKTRTRKPCQNQDDDYAQHELGDITFVDVDPDLVGETLDAQEEFGAIEAVKTTAELLMPVAGEVLEVNEALADEENAKLVNTDPYGEAWIIKIKVNNVADLDNLLDAAAYEAKIG